MQSLSPLLTLTMGFLTIALTSFHPGGCPVSTQSSVLIRASMGNVKEPVYDSIHCMHSSKAHFDRGDHAGLPEQQMQVHQFLQIM